MNHINIKLLGAFFASVILLAVVSFYINFYTNSLNNTLNNEISIKKSVDDINFYSVSIINNLIFYLDTTPGKQASLKEEYNYSVGEFKQAIEELQKSNRKDRPISIIIEKYGNFFDNAQKIIESADQKTQKKNDFANLVKEVDDAGDKISKDSQILPAKMRNDVAQMRDIEDIFYFQHPDKEHADAWVNSINIVGADLRREKNFGLEKDFLNYSHFAFDAIAIKMDINDLVLRDQYFLDKAKYAAVDINSASNILSKTIDNELAVTNIESNRQRKISWIVILLVSIFGGAVILYISRGIVSAINNLMLVAGSVSAGDVNRRVNIKSNDELGYLGNVFNKMLENIGELIKSLSFAKKQLEATNQSLEEKVHDRTAELRKFKDDLERIVDARTNELKVKLAELERFKELTVGRELKMVELKKEIEELRKKQS